MAAAIGDNSKMLTPAEERALFFHHYTAIAAQRAIVEVARAEEKRLRKLAKADQIVMRDVDFAMRCAEIDDSDIIVNDLARQVKIARWFALPIGEEPELNFDREPLVDRAAREGTAAGLAAKPRNAPYAVDTEAGQIWLSNYDAAQKEVAANFQAAMEKRNSERAATEAAAAQAKSAKTTNGTGNGHAPEKDAEYVEGDEDEDEDETETETAA
jgi:hypothetical protein